MIYTIGLNQLKQPNKYKVSQKQTDSRLYNLSFLFTALTRLFSFEKVKRSSFLCFLMKTKPYNLISKIFMQHDFQEKETETVSNKIFPEFTANVKVSDPVVDSTKGFYTYLITGSDDKGSFEIRRRYNDFFYFREALTKQWPGVYIPPIPEKKIAGNKDSQNIERRKRFFDFFMKRIAKLKHIFTCSITNDFLRTKAVDMEKVAASLNTPKYSEFVAEYRTVYEKLDLSEKGNHELKNNIQNFNGFLKKAEKELEGLKYQVEIIVEARAGFTQNLNNVNSTLLPDYEKTIYAEYLPQEEKKDPQLIFVNNQKVQQNISSLKEVAAVNSFNVCLDHIVYEILEIRAMQETLKIKEKYEQDEKVKKSELLELQSQLAKLNSGKTTFKSFFSRGSKDDQVQKLSLSIPELEKEISSLQELNQILTIIFGKAELPIFKKNKQIQYYRMMYEISENEIKYLATYGEFMKSVMQGLNK